MTERYLIVKLILVAVIFASCKDAGKTNGKAAIADSIYMDYKISADESEGMVTCFFQYRKGGPEGESVSLQQPSKAELDGQLLLPDSAGVIGTYYEAQLPLESFTGKHAIRFTDGGNNRFTEFFRFQPFEVQNIEEEMNRENMVLTFSGLQPNDKVRVVMTDTSFFSEGINEVMPVRNGALEISENLLQKVKNGPIVMQLIKEDEQPVKNGTKAGGKMYFTYSLQREFLLKD